MSSMLCSSESTQCLITLENTEEAWMAHWCRSTEKVRSFFSSANTRSSEATEGRGRGEGRGEGEGEEGG